MAKEIEKTKKVTNELMINTEMIQQLQQRYELFRKLQQDVLEEDVDYGYPSGRREGKPSLYKSGAEKLTQLFNLIVDFIELESIETEQEVRYKFRCELRTVNGRLVGVGYGFASSFEKNHWRSNPLGNANTILKIAKKRSHVDAVLTGLGASNVFTQDIEDYEASQLEEPIEPSDGQFKLLATLISRYAAKFGKTPPAAEEALERIIGKKIKDLSKNEMHLLITFMSVVRLDNAKEVFEFILSKIHNNNSFWNVLKENSNLIEQLVQKRIIFDEFKKRFK